MLGFCFLTVMYNFDIFKAGVLGVCLVAVFGLAYVSRSRMAMESSQWVLADHVEELDVTVSEGFYIASAWIFAISDQSPK